MGRKILSRSIIAMAMSLIFLICTGFVDYTPETNALSGGTWKKNSDGNWTYIGTDGVVTRNAWVKDGTTVFFIGYDGVLVKDNYATDGYYADSTGAWDQTKGCRDYDVEPNEGAYEGPGNAFVFTTTQNGNQSFVQMINRQTGEAYATCAVTSVGHGCMMAWESGDTNEYDQILMSVSDDRQTLRVSFMGVTEICTYNPSSEYSTQTGINYQSKTGSSNTTQGDNGLYSNSFGNTGEFIFPYSDTQLISASDAYYLSDWQLRIAINEIYARHGRIFRDKELQNYFNALSWYKGVYESGEFDKLQDSILNEIEKDNINTLVKERESRK